MTFVQCLTYEDVEKTMKKLGMKSGFVGDPFRVYQEIEFLDEDLVYQVDSETFRALYDLQTALEMESDDQNEMGFQNVVEHAKQLEKAFKNAVKAIKFKPIKKKLTADSK